MASDMPRGAVLGALTMAELIRLVRAEYAEMPGLALTLAQAQRLWSADAPACEGVFAALVDAKVLVRLPNGSFVRASAEAVGKTAASAWRPSGSLPFTSQAGVDRDAETRP